MRKPKSKITQDMYIQMSDILAREAIDLDKVMDGEEKKKKKKEKKKKKKEKKEFV